MNDKNLCPRYDFIATGDKHLSSQADPYPAIAAYPTGVVNTDWSSMELFMQLESSEHLDLYQEAFSTGADGLENPSDNSTKVRERLSSYAALQMGHQF